MKFFYLNNALNKDKEQRYSADPIKVTSITMSNIQSIGAVLYASDLSE